ncbi:MAG TPA: DinB family protein [Anaerolineae bacterium]|nr:DinB family protein [Anaerolineae bacterium]
MLAELESRVRELERNRQTFTAFLETLHDEQWNEPIGEEQYTARQTLAHLAGAAKSMTRMGQNWVAGNENYLRPDFDLNYFNARQQQKRAQLSTAELLEEWHAAHHDLIAFMETVREEDLDKRGEHPTVKHTTLRNLFVVITTHEADHIRLVMEAFAG